MSGTEITTQPADNTPELVDALLNGQPIAGQLLNAAATGNPQMVADIQDKSGFHVTAEGMSKALQATDPGPTFDIRAVGGVYQFSTPADMTNKSMVVDPSTGRLMINDLWVSNTTDLETGHVLFNLSGYQYDLIFTYNFNSDGIPSPVTVSGTRKMTNSAPETVTALQIINPPTAWYNKPDWLQTGLLITVITGSLGLLLALWDKTKKWREEKDAQRKEQFRRDMEHLGTHVEHELEEAQLRCNELAMETVLDPPPVDGLQISVQDAIKEEVTRTLRDQPLDQIDMEVVRGAAAVAVKDALFNSYREANAATIQQRIEPFRAVLDKNPLELDPSAPPTIPLSGVEVAVNTAISNTLEQLPLFADPVQFQWVTDIADAQVAQLQYEAARNAAIEATAQRTQLERELQEVQHQAEAARSQKDELERLGDQEEPAVQEQLLEETRRIEELDRQAADKQAEIHTAQAEVDQQQEISREKDHDRRAAEHAARQEGFPGE